MLSALPMAELRERADRLAREVREIDVRIQRASTAFRGERAPCTIRHQVQIRDGAGGNGYLRIIQ